MGDALGIVSVGADLSHLPVKGWLLLFLDTGIDKAHPVIRVVRSEHCPIHEATQ